MARKPDYAASASMTALNHIERKRELPRQRRIRSINPRPKDGLFPTRPGPASPQRGLWCSFVIFVIIDDSGIVIGLRSRAREETLIYFNGGEGVESGHGGFIATPCQPRRLEDLNAVLPRQTEQSRP